jgi:hypothetical protein
VVFVPIHTNFYMNYSTNSYKVWFFYFVSSLPAQAARNKLFGNTKRSSRFFIRIVSRIGIKKFHQQKHVRKNWTPPFAQVCGNMYNYVLKNSIHHPQKWIIRFDSNGISLSGNFHYASISTIKTQPQLWRIFINKLVSTISQTNNTWRKLRLSAFQQL